MILHIPQAPDVSEDDSASEGVEDAKSAAEDSEDESRKPNTNCLVFVVMSRSKVTLLSLHTPVQHA